jgi:hypothetical protein
LIDDVREAPSYYRAGDVAVSPFTPIGQVAHNMPEEGSVPIKVRRRPSRPRNLPPIIPAGFLTTYNNPEADEFAPTEHSVVVGPAKAAPRGLSALTSSLWGSVFGSAVAGKLLTRKSTARSHKTSTYVGSAVVAAILIALLLALGPVPSSRIHNPAGGAGTSGHGVNGSYTSNFVLTSGDHGSSGAAAGQSDSSPAGPSASQLLDSNVIGGLGSGSIGGTTQPVTDTLGTVTSPITGGSGGGTTIPTSPSIPGVTQPQPVTLPGTDVNLLGKPVVSTSPIGVTLN